MSATDNDVAQEALNRADATELHALYVKKVQECDKIGEALNVVTKHYCGQSGTPRYIPSESAIGAMERVALAAIELAKAVTESQKSK